MYLHETFIYYILTNSEKENLARTKTSAAEELNVSRRTADRRVDFFESLEIFDDCYLSYIDDVEYNHDDGILTIGIDDNYAEKYVQDFHGLSLHLLNRNDPFNTSEDEDLGVTLNLIFIDGEIFDFSPTEETEENFDECAKSLFSGNIETSSESDDVECETSNFWHDVWEALEIDEEVNEDSPVIPTEEDSFMFLCSGSSDLEIINQSDNESVSYSNEDDIKAFLAEVSTSEDSNVVCRKYFDLKSKTLDFDSSIKTLEYDDLHGCLYIVTGDDEKREKLPECILIRWLDGKLTGDNCYISRLEKFIINITNNLEKEIVENVFAFMKHNSINIDEEGYMIGYRAVRRDYYDHHSVSVLYEIGTTVGMSRDDCDDNPNKTCSTGLHVGSLEYVSSFYSRGDSRILKVRVNPMNIVAVPYDYDGQKLRCCELEVLEEIKND